MQHGRCCRSLDSEAGVGYWTDYLKTFLHPRSLFQLPGVWRGQGRFGAFGEGRGLFGASETPDDVMDRVRYWVEECDAFQVTLTYCLVTYLHLFASLYSLSHSQSSYISNFMQRFTLIGVLSVTGEALHVASCSI